VEKSKKHLTELGILSYPSSMKDLKTKGKQMAKAPQKRHLNIEVTSEAYFAAKHSALNAGMLLRTWMERTILAMARAEAPQPQIEEQR
jgi:hypothetical protein